MTYDKLCFELLQVIKKTSDENTKERLNEILQDIEKNGIQEDK